MKESKQNPTHRPGHGVQLGTVFRAREKLRRGEENRNRGKGSARGVSWHGGGGELITARAKLKHSLLSPIFTSRRRNLLEEGASGLTECRLPTQVQEERGTISSGRKYRFLRGDDR